MKCMFAVFGCCVAICLRVHACEPGYYPNTQGECIICPVQYACPDGTKRIKCDTNTPGHDPDVVPQYSDGQGAVQCLDCPTDILHTENFRYFWVNTTGNTSNVTDCRASWAVLTEHGRNSFSCSYYPDSGYYDLGEKGNHCMIDVTRCDAGYVSGIKKISTGLYRTWVTSYEKCLAEYCVPAGVGYYATADDLEGIECPVGTSTHTDIAGGPDECVPLCDAGATRLHVGKYEFNMWLDGQCSAPAINVGMSGGGVCCVNLAPGSGVGLNLNYAGSIYHATD